MASPVRGKLWPFVVLPCVHALLLLLLWSKSQVHVQAVDLLRTTKAGNLANPPDGPAIYKGRLYGPEGRVEPKGKAVAAHWWWVTKRVGKNNWKTVCFKREIGKLRFVDGAGRTATLPAFDTEESLALAGTNWTDDYTDRMVVDFGYEQPVYETEVAPAAAKECFAKGYKWSGRSIPAGAQVEILACARNGELLPCADKPALVIVVGSMGQHLGRRISDAQTPFVVEGMIAFGVTVGLTLYALFVRGRVLATFSPKRGVS